MFPTQPPKIIKADHHLPEVPEDLLCKVMTRIHNERQIAAAKNRLIIWAGGLTVALVALFPAIHLLISDLAESGFIQYLSLFFSDTGIILNQWENFIFSLLETLPLTGLIASLGTILIVLYMAKMLAKEIQKISPVRGLVIKF